MDIGIIVNFISNHFELFWYLYLAFLILTGVLLLALRFTDITVRIAFYATLKSIVYIAVVVSQALLLSLSGYVYWINYYSPSEVFNFPKDVLPDTHWLPAALTIYFIDGNSLKAIEVNGRGQRTVFKAQDPIREYSFSPDGKNLLISTYQSLYLLSLKTKESVLIDTVGLVMSDQDSPPERQTEEKSQEGGFKGTIRSIHWSPESRKFCYEISRWSNYSSKDQLYLYDIGDKQKIPIEAAIRQVSSLYWDKKGDNLYYVYPEVLDTSVRGYAYEIKVSRIPLSSLRPELVAQIPSNQSTIPVDHLLVRNIELFLEGDRLVFSRQSGSKELLVSDQGKVLGIDQEDHLYFVNRQWFRKRLFKIPRETVPNEIPRYQYKGGDLTVRHIRWLPGSRLVMMEHRYLGTLILEPATNRIGQLVEVNGDTLGWYSDISKPIDFKGVQQTPFFDRVYRWFYPSKFR